MCSTPYRVGKSLDSYCCKNQGGKKSTNADRLRFVRAVFGGVSFNYHCRLSVFHSCPGPRLRRPLYTTFIHILRLSCLLSTTKLQVVILRQVWTRKPLE